MDDIVERLRAIAPDGRTATHGSICEHAADEIERLRAEARAGYDVIAVVMGDGGHHREAVGTRQAADNAIARVVELRAELERERMRLAACGVVALADAPESARQAREMHRDYRSASCDDVARRVDECMRLRAELADAMKAIDRLHDERRRLEGAQNELRAARIKIKRQRVELARLNKAHRIVWGAFIVSTQGKNELRPTGHYGPLDAAVKMMSKESGWLTWAAGLAAKKRSGSNDR